MLIHILFTLLIYGLVFWAIYYILGLFPLPAPFPQVIRVVLVALAVLLVVNLLLPLAGGVGCRGLLC